ncbi:MAG: hypothetical protein HY897_16250 [Deltaproteobacteria bacterium]|nr:hypothetical protein [Deltaproteobacteria bacterium]
MNVFVAALVAFLSGSEAGISWDVPYEYRLGFSHLSDITLDGTDALLGQNSWLEQRFRLSPSVSWKPLTLKIEFDTFDGIVDGDVTSAAVAHSRVARSHKRGWAVDRFNLREAYLLADTPYGRIAAGQMAAKWGLGLVSNDGRAKPAFGEARGGDITERVYAATKPLKPVLKTGFFSDLAVAAGADYVIADAVAQNAKGDIAWQVFAALMHEPEKAGGDRGGLYYARRWQTDRDGARLDVNVLDAFVEESRTFEFEKGALTLYWAAEGAYVFGSTGMVTNLAAPEGQEIREWGFVGRGGLRAGGADVHVDLGHASGDGNPFDAEINAFKFNPEFREGMILFGEVLAFQSAAAERRFDRPDLLAVPPEGTQLLGTNGAITNATFLAIAGSAVFAKLWRLDLAVVLAEAARDIIDPFYTFRAGEARNFLDGKAGGNYLGTEIDVGLERRIPVVKDLNVRVRLEYGHLFAGEAFADRLGRPHADVDLVYGRLSIEK